MTAGLAPASAVEKPDAVGYLNNLSAGCGGMHYIVWDTDGGDEVSVRARFVDGDCGSRVQNTNVVKGSF